MLHISTDCYPVPRLLFRQIKQKAGDLVSAEMEKVIKDPAQLGVVRRYRLKFRENGRILTIVQNWVFSKWKNANYENS